MQQQQQQGDMGCLQWCLEVNKKTFPLSLHVTAALAFWKVMGGHRSVSHPRRHPMDGKIRHKDL